MKKVVMGAVLLLMVSSLYAGKGKVRIAADKEGAYIYVDGKKKAMTGEGFTSVLLEEGEHTIKVAKPKDKYYEYSAQKKVFVGEDTSGSFGILADHSRMMTTLVVGLARFRIGDTNWQ